jgi:hypothetical protein
MEEMERIGNGENPNSPNTLLQYIWSAKRTREWRGGAVETCAKYIHPTIANDKKYIVLTGLFKET